MKKYILYGSTLAVTWIFVTGSPTLPTFIQGLFLGVPVSFAFRRFYPGNIRLAQLETTPYLLKYIGVFLESLVMSNIEVAHNLLRPSKSVNPEIITYKSGLNSSTGLTVLAESITLTPGTLVADYKEETNELLIHCLNADCKEETKKEIHKWEIILSKVFG